MPIETPPTFIDVFAGCGGLSLGLMNAGWRGIFAIERDENAFQTLSKNLIESPAARRFAWPEWLPKSPHNATDFIKKYGREIKRLKNTVDMLVGGPPCQGFSSAGRRDPNDPRNKLTEAYLEIVNHLSPKIVLIENVKGIAVDFSSEEGKEGKTNYAKWIIESLSEKYDVSHRLIDTSLFGVPQKRHRFFIVAIKRSERKKNSESPFEALERVRNTFLRSKGLIAPVSAISAISDLEIKKNGVEQSEESNGFEKIAYKGPLTAYQKLMNKDVGMDMHDTRLARHGIEIKNRFEKIIEICHANNRLNISLSKELRASFGLRKCAIRVMDPDLPAPTITSMPDDLIHYSEPRALTVRENARLQSFPDWFQFRGKYTTGGDRRKKEVPRFTQVANAVPPLIAEALGLALLNWLKGCATLQKERKTAPQNSRDEIEALI